MKSFKHYLSEKRNTEDKTTTVPEWIKDQKDYTSNIRTQIYESTVCIVAVKGANPTIEDIRKVAFQGKWDTNPIAKEFYKRWFDEHDGQTDAYTALRAWVQAVGGKAAILGKMNSFIHKGIDDYYKAAPATFEVPAATKSNTADAILIKKGTHTSVITALETLQKLSEKDQKLRIKTSGSGLDACKVTIIDGKGSDIVSFYQCSLKNDGQVGKSGAYLNRNYIGGVEKKASETKSGKEKLRSISSPTSALASWEKLREALGEEYLYERMLEEGKLLDFAKGKLSKVVSSMSSFMHWAANKLSKIIKKVVGTGQSIANKLLRRNKGLKAIENIFSQIGQPLSEEFNPQEFFSEAKKDEPVPLTKGMIVDFKLVYDTFLKTDLINQVHGHNKRLLNELNKLKDTNRTQDPVVMHPGINEAEVKDIDIWMKKIEPLTTITWTKKTGYNPGDYKWPRDFKDHITRDALDPMFKIAMNFSANVAVYGILNGMLADQAKFNVVTSAALFALSGQLEGEVRFGNTALPLVIIYGGKHQEIKAMGKRDEFVKDLTDKLDPALLGDFPILVFRYNKQGSKKDGQYNTINMRLLSKMEEMGDKFKPKWLEFGIRTNTGSSFSCTIEASGETYNWRGK